MSKVILKVMNILLKRALQQAIAVIIKKGWDTTYIREAKYKNTKVNPKDVPVAVYGGHVENSKSNAAVDTSLLNSMSQLSTNPNTSYVIETDPNFTNRRNFLSSDYVLSRLKLDPMNIQNDWVMGITSSNSLCKRLCVKPVKVDCNLVFPQKSNIAN